MLIHTSTRAAHIEAVRQVFEKCSQVNLHIRKEKCAFLQTSIKTMGFLVEHGVIKPDPSKVDMLQKARPPKNVEELQSFLGLTQFYRNMLPHLAHVAYPLYAATSDNYDFQWTEKLQKAFEQVKEMITKDILQTTLKGEDEISVLVDASKHAVCVVLMQHQRIVYCASKVLNSAQRNWATIERELFAISWGCKKLRCFLYGVKFTIYTDHKPLLGLFKKTGDVPNSRIQQMLLAAAEYTFELEYIPGVRNIIADYGSRQIDLNEWDKPQPDDEEGLHELMLTISHNTNEQEYDLVYFGAELIGKTDLEYIEKRKLPKTETDGLVKVTVKDQQLVWIPHSSKRAYFWLIHSRLHEGATKLVDYLRLRGIYWSNALLEINEMLTQCVCVIKKNSTPRAYSEKKHIQSQHTLHILAVDLYSYNDKLYFTAICIFSKYAWVHEIQNAEAATVKKIYEKFCYLFKEPLLLSCDNGKEFSTIDTVKVNNPAYHPQSNGVIERFHLELGKQSRIHGIMPDEAVKFMNSEQSSLMMNSYIQKNEQILQNSICVLHIATRRLQYNSLAWKYIHPRGRAKHEDTYTGPHRILKEMGKFSYLVTSHRSNTRKMQVNINDLKEFIIPCTAGWILKNEYFEAAMDELNVKKRDSKVLINFNGIESFIQDVLDGKLTDIRFLIVPDWPAMSWYGRLHREITAEAIKLPKKADLFMDIHDREMGLFAWDHWFFSLEL
jgi:RNase H-like domain found in reverse transcriptase